jgi:hypothetical protein
MITPKITDEEEVLPQISSQHDVNIQQVDLIKRARSVYMNLNKLIMMNRCEME